MSIDTYFLMWNIVSYCLSTNPNTFSLSLRNFIFHPINIHWLNKLLLCEYNSLPDYISQLFIANMLENLVFPVLTSTWTFRWRLLWSILTVKLIRSDKISIRVQFSKFLYCSSWFSKYTITSFTNSIHVLPFLIFIFLIYLFIFNFDHDNSESRPRFSWFKGAVLRVAYDVS